MTNYDIENQQWFIRTLGSFTPILVLYVFIAIFISQKNWEFYIKLARVITDIKCPVNSRKVHLWHTKTKPLLCYVRFILLHHLKRFCILESCDPFINHSPCIVQISDWMYLISRLSEFSQLNTISTSLFHFIYTYLNFNSISSF